MTYIAIAVLLTWATTAALFVAVGLTSYARDRRDRRGRIANRLASVQHFYGADSGSQEK